MSDQGLMRRYLLGTAKPEESSDFEHKYLCDAGIFEELVEVENDLIDAYARRQLPGTEMREFERRYLSSERGRARVQYASALAELSLGMQEVALVQRSSLWSRLASLFAQPNRGLRLGLAGALATVLIILSVKLANHRPVDTANQASNIPASSTTAPLPGAHQEEIAKSNGPELGGLIVPLTPGIARDAESREQVITIPSKASSITFRLLLEADSHPAYVAVLETAEGHRIQRSDKLRSQQLDGSNVVEVLVAATLIRSGDYVIRLSGTAGTRVEAEEVEAYTFRALHQ